MMLEGTVMSHSGYIIHHPCLKKSDGSNADLMKSSISDALLGLYYTAASLVLDSFRIQCGIQLLKSMSTFTKVKMTDMSS